jgi:hypothetical protein
MAIDATALEYTLGSVISTPKIFRWSAKVMNEGFVATELTQRNSLGR